MTYKVTITSSDGQASTYVCSGSNDQMALIYAGKVVQAQANEADLYASVNVTRDGHKVGPAATVGDMVKRAI